MIYECRYTSVLESRLQHNPQLFNLFIDKCSHAVSPFAHLASFPMTSHRPEEAESGRRRSSVVLLIICGCESPWWLLAAFYSNGDCSIWSSFVRQWFYCGEQRGGLFSLLQLFTTYTLALSPLVSIVILFSDLLMFFSGLNTQFYSETLLTFPVRIFYVIDL